MLSTANKDTDPLHGTCSTEEPKLVKFVDFCEIIFAQTTILNCANINDFKKLNVKC